MLLGVIILVGIFLRTYHFEQWLQFNPDQVRDAMVVGDAISGQSPLPLLGTVAGGTFFHLGPMFYYFQYFSALVFGNTPQAMAYPDLFFSILAIGLLFFFLRKYFSDKASLLLTAVMSVSYFAVINSRFAWNPNSIPFFVLLFLYALLEMTNIKNRHSYRWSVLAGVGLGVGVQLHTLLLLIMPFMAIVVLVYLIRKKTIIWKSVWLVFLLAILLNSPQIFSEVQTKGANTKNFFLGTTAQTNAKNEMGDNLLGIVSCQMEFNFHMISGYESKEECNNILAVNKVAVKKYSNIPGNFSDADLFMLSVVAGLAFSLGGYILLGYYFRREHNQARKDFLGLIILFNTISIFALVPVASHITMRYFIILFFVPFILLGLWGKFLMEKTREMPRTIMLIIWAILILTNFFVIMQYAKPYMEKRANNGENSILGEVQPIAEFIQKSAGSQKTAYMAGERIYEKRFFPALSYLLKQKEFNLIEILRDYQTQTNQNQTGLVFYVANADKTEYEVGGSLAGCAIEDLGKFNSVVILKVQNCEKLIH